MSYDLMIIKNGTVVDGTGAPPRKADVGVLSGKIVELGAELGGGPDHRR
jgi:N-acyl-D-aspartate/D-glutamate deacylase